MVDEQSRRSVALAEGRRGVTTQLDLFARTVVVELEVARSSDVVVCDRSLVDILAYTDLLPPDSDASDPSDAAMRRAMDAFAEHYLATYAAIFLPSWRLEAVDDDPLRAPVRHRQDELAAHIERRLAPYADRVVRLARPGHRRRRGRRPDPRRPVTMTGCQHPPAVRSSAPASPPSPRPA